MEISFIRYWVRVAFLETKIKNPHTRINPPFESKCWHVVIYDEAQSNIVSVSSFLFSWEEREDVVWKVNSGSSCSDCWLKIHMKSIQQMKLWTKNKPKKKETPRDVKVKRNICIQKIQNWGLFSFSFEFKFRFHRQDSTARLTAVLIVTAWTYR